MNEKLDFKGVKGGRLENFWYYHKWKILIAAFFSIVLIICVVQMVERESPDMYIMYAGQADLSATDVPAMRNALRAVIEDYNGDGEVGTTFVNITCRSEEQIAALESRYAAESEPFPYDLKAANQSSLKTFDAEIFAGESVICLLDPWLYSRVREAGGFMPMSEIFTKEELAGLEMYDACGIYFDSTKFSEYYPVFGELPDDTILCIRRVSTMSVFKGKKKYEQIHENHIDALRKIALFEFPEGYVPDTSADTGDETTGAPVADTAVTTG